MSPLVAAATQPQHRQPMLRRVAQVVVAIGDARATTGLTGVGTLQGSFTDGNGYSSPSLNSRGVCFLSPFAVASVGRFLPVAGPIAALTLAILVGLAVAGVSSFDQFWMRGFPFNSFGPPSFGGLVLSPISALGLGLLFGCVVDLVCGHHTDCIK